MPLGPTRCAPASACAIAIRRYRSSGRVVVDVGAVGGQHAAVAVVGVLVQAEVADHDGVVAELLAQRGDRPLADARRGSRPRSPRRPCVAGTPNSMNARTPVSAISTASLRSDSSVCWNWPGMEAIGDRLVDAFLGEQRRDQVAGVERGLAHQRAQRGRAPQPPGTRRGEAHDLRVPGRARQEPARRRGVKTRSSAATTPVDRVGIRHGVTRSARGRAPPSPSPARCTPPWGCPSPGRAPRRTRARWRRS